MIIDLKNIHIGDLINKHFQQKGIDEFRVCRFLKCSELEWRSILSQQSLDTEILLKLSTLLEYDFFRIYSQHLILYAPQASTHYNKVTNKKSSLPYFRKNIYMKEVIDFILEQIESGNKTKAQIIEEYRIPKTTIYKWVYKYRKSKDDGKGE
ncbi:hypothetical protein QFZ37_002273 [Chryseobacterium ginsenosidimutans]|uniref:transposase n=1 Tax=Chryseobacterium ginsenosidimutans TaxID=687846 RepID=UPI0027873C99|nr:transposase [Chryseobacterium ginsenosidimutans]MDQ0593904.1 hypothetical protein [Chryseobacterium ginsenosidimutans]